MPSSVPVRNVDDVEEALYRHGAHWESLSKALTGGRSPGHLGVVLVRVPPGKSGCPFHTHQLEDEVFFVLSGRGVLRFGDTTREIRPGDCITCRAGTGIAHQLANPFAEDLRYLAIGMHEENEVCTYPDSGQVMIRGLGRNGFLRDAEYHEGQPDPPRILSGRCHT